MKASLVSPAVFPKVAIIDPDLAVGIPHGSTAACGADALGHAIEACRAARQIRSQRLPPPGLGLIVQHLPRAVADAVIPPPRAAGVSRHAGLRGLQRGRRDRGPRGGPRPGRGLARTARETVAIATPLMLRFNAEACVEVYAELAAACGLRADSPEELAARFVMQIGELLRSVGLPERVVVPRSADVPLGDLRPGWSRGRPVRIMRARCPRPRKILPPCWPATPSLTVRCHCG